MSRKSKRGSRLKATALAVAIGVGGLIGPGGLGGLGGPLPAWAEDQETRVRAPEVVVTATRTERELLEVPASTSVVTSDRIKEEGVTSVADALRDVPGVEVFDQSIPGAKRVMIRGESGSRVLILIDGQKVSEQKSMDGSPLLISPSLVERIEVIKGPASVLYGSEAIGGVVNIITKKGGTKPVEAEVSSTFDSSTSGFENFASVFGKSKGFSYRFSGSYSDQGDRITADDKRVANTDSYNRELAAYIDYTVEKLKVGYAYDNYEARIHSYIPPSYLTATMPFFQLALPEWSREKHSAFIELKDLSPVLLKARLDGFFQNTYKDFQNNMDIVTSSGVTRVNVQNRINTKNDQDTTGGNLQFDWLFFDDHHVITGFEFNGDNLDATSTTKTNTQVRVMGNLVANTDKVTQYNYKGWINTYSIYAQDEWRLPADFTLTLGGRQTWIESKITSTNDPSLASRKKKSNDENAVFSAGLVWRGIKDTAFRALAAQGYKHPNLQQLYIGTTHGSGTPTYANPDLKPETSITGELGARYDNGAFYIDLGGFYTQSEDYITTQLQTGGAYSMYVNVDEAVTYGSELSVGYTFVPVSLTPYVTGTYMRRQFKTTSYTTWDTGQAEFMGRAGLRFDRDVKDWGVRLIADLYTRFADRARDRNSDGSTVITPAWETLNLTTGVNFGDERQYRVSLNVNNIFDRKYTTAQNTVPEAGRSVVVGVSVKF